MQLTTLPIWKSQLVRALLLSPHLVKLLEAAPTIEEITGVGGSTRPTEGPGTLTPFQYRELPSPDLTTAVALAITTNNNNKTTTIIIATPTIIAGIEVVPATTRDRTMEIITILEVTASRHKIGVKIIITTVTKIGVETTTTTGTTTTTTETIIEIINVTTAEKATTTTNLTM